MIYDDRIKGMPCETCRTGRDLIIGEVLPLDCEWCSRRPKKYDKDHFELEYKTDYVKDLMDSEAKKGSKYNF